MIEINSTSVAVGTSAELVDVLSSDSYSYTTIYFSDDITLEAGVRIPATKTEIVIDGFYPLDGTGTTHTYTDMNSTAYTDAIYVNTSGARSLTMQNMTVVGRNYYGIFPVHDSIEDITLTFDNVTYTGPQMGFNTYGATIVTDCDVTIQATSLVAVNEAFETYQLTLGKTTTINKIGTDNALFWFRGKSDSPSLTIAKDAVVSLAMDNYCFYTDTHPALIIEEGATFTLTPAVKFFAGSGHYVSSVSVAEDATMICTQGTSSSGSFNCHGSFVAQEGATVKFINEQSTNPPLRFLGSPSLALYDPSLFLIYCTTSEAASFAATTGLTVTAPQLNLWTTASGSYEDDGGLDDTPTYAWRKSDATKDVELSATLTNSATTTVSTNMASSDMDYDFSYLLLNSSQVFAVGNLPLTTNAINSNDMTVSGTTSAGATVELSYSDDCEKYSYTVTANANTGEYSILLNNAIAAGTIVTIYAGTPFLIVQISIVVEVWEGTAS